MPAGADDDDGLESEIPSSASRGGSGISRSGLRGVVCSRRARVLRSRPSSMRRILVDVVPISTSSVVRSGSNVGVRANALNSAAASRSIATGSMPTLFRSPRRSSIFSFGSAQTMSWLLPSLSPTLRYSRVTSFSRSIPGK